MNKLKLRLMGAKFRFLGTILCLVIGGLILFFTNLIFIGILFIISGVFTVCHLIIKPTEAKAFIILAIIIAISRIAFYKGDVNKIFDVIIAVIILTVVFYIGKKSGLMNIEDIHRNYPLTFPGLVGIFLVIAGVIFLIPIIIYPFLKSLQMIMIETIFFVSGSVLIYLNYRSWRRKKR